MENKFVSVIRPPDNDFGATELSPFRFEESATKASDVKYEYIITGRSAKVIV